MAWLPFQNNNPPALHLAMFLFPLPSTMLPDSVICFEFGYFFKSKICVWLLVNSSENLFKPGLEHVLNQFRKMLQNFMNLKCGKTVMELI